MAVESRYIQYAFSVHLAGYNYSRDIVCVCFVHLNLNYIFFPDGLRSD